MYRLFKHFKLRIERNTSYIGTLNTIQVEATTKPPLDPYVFPKFGTTMIDKEYQDCMVSTDTTPFTIWTDGSYKNDKIGWAVVTWNPITKLWGHRRGNMDTTISYGSHHAYVAELVALTVALCDFGHLSFQLFTDNKEFLSLIKKTLITERQKIRQPGRPLLRIILSLLHKNPNIFFRFVSTKTHIKGIEITGLTKADQYARRARGTDVLQDFDIATLDYPVQVTHNTYPLIGDYRSLLDGIMWRYQFSGWKKCERQSLCLLYVNDDIKDALTTLRKQVGPTNAMSPWFIDSVVHNLPNYRMVSLTIPPPQCPLCHYKHTDDSTHYLTCPRLQQVLTKISVPHTKYFRTEWRQILLPSLITKFQKLLSECKSLILQSIPELTPPKAEGMVTRYWLDKVLQRTEFRQSAFLDTCCLLGGQNPSSPEDTNPLTPAQLTQISKLPHSLIVVDQIRSVPRSSARWSTYGHVEEPLIELGQYQWYNVEPPESILFGFQFYTQGREFSSLERFTCDFCQNGGTVILLTNFSREDIKYIVPTHLKLVCKWNEKIQVFVWKFVKSLASVKDQRPCNIMINWNVFRKINREQSLCLIPFWGSTRVLFSLPSELIPRKYYRDWKYFRTLLEYPLLLGVVPSRVSDFFLKPKPTSQGFFLGKRNWRLLKKIYQIRRNLYKELKKV